MGPGVSCECHEKRGLRIAEDHFIPETINPETGETLPFGEKGELVLTTITKEAYPLIRYRTGDLTSLIHGTCPCGRTGVRMERVFERIDDMIIFNGQNMFPSQFEKILHDVIGVIPRYQLIVDKKDNLDVLEIQIEVSGAFFDDEMKKLTEIELNIIKTVEDRLGFIPAVKLIEPKALERRMKKQRVIDRRYKKS